MKVQKFIPLMVSSVLFSALMGTSTDVSSKSINSNHSDGGSPEWIACGGGGGGGSGNAKKKKAAREAKLKALMEMQESQEQDSSN